MGLDDVGHIGLVLAEALGADAAPIPVSAAAPRAQTGKLPRVQPPTVHITELHEAQVKRSSPVVVRNRRLTIQHRCARVHLRSKQSQQL